MYIQNVNYRTQIDALQKARYIMIAIMANPTYRQTILDLIANKVDCLGIYYDEDRHEINITVKKTTMKRAKGYKPNTMYYYGIMSMVFGDFFANNPDIIMQMQMNTGIDLYGITSQNFTGLSFCEVYCIGDKSVNIRF